MRLAEGGGATGVPVPPSAALGFPSPIPSAATVEFDLAPSVRSCPAYPSSLDGQKNGYGSSGVKEGAGEDGRGQAPRVLDRRATILSQGPTLLSGV
jgi:hypothetical protein